MIRAPHASQPAGPFLIAALLATSAAGCVEVQNFYRDVGLGDDTPEDDVPRLDVPGQDVPGAPEDAPIMIGADATRAVLASVGQRVILPALVDFVARAAALESATDALRTGGAAELDAARTAWRDAQSVWQRVEMFQLGPAGLPSVTLGGRALRDEINGWPLLTRCTIDRHTVGPEHADVPALAAASINVRGLSAMEYLLFSAGADNGCGPTAEINTSGAWAALGDAEVRRRRSVYAHSLAVLIHQRAIELRTAWEPGGGNFVGALATAGAGSAVYSSSQMGLNALSDALFYLYKEVVDYKLGIPVGLRMECPADACPDQVESRWAGASLDHIRVNLEAFRDAYLGAPAGTDGPGFDDLLVSIGAPDLDARIQLQISLAFAALEAITTPLELAVTSDAARVVALHDALRAVADSFRVEVGTCLDLQPPMRIEGDND